MNAAETILREELHALLAGLREQVGGEDTIAEISAMANDALMLPARMLAGQDVADLQRSLAAEASNRSKSHRVQAQQLVLQSYLRLVGRVIGTALLG